MWVSSGRVVEKLRVGESVAAEGRKGRERCGKEDGRWEF